jgi:hypothetical protein
MNFFYLSIAIALLGFSIPAKAQQAQFKFAATNYNYGDVPKGPDAVTEFEFENTGTQELLITDCKGSCSCTKPEFSRVPVAPGGKGKIKVSFETKDKEGKFKKTVYVFSNATPAREPLELTIEGNVLVPASEVKADEKEVASTTVKATSKKVKTQKKKKK